MALRRRVSNEEYKQALANPDNIKVIKSFLGGYRGKIPDADLERCGEDALWRCLSYHEEGRGNKLTTSLWRFLTWECNRELKRITKDKGKHTITFSTIETKDVFDPADKSDTEQVRQLRNCLYLLPEEDQNILQKYFFDRMTMQEMADMYGYTKETARNKINKAVAKLRERFMAGV
jgi:RNA polymerase sigma factor (sigma-70 family)